MTDPSLWLEDTKGRVMAEQAQILVGALDMVRSGKSKSLEVSQALALADLFINPPKDVSTGESF